MLVATYLSHQDICKDFVRLLELIRRMGGSLQEEVVQDEGREGLVVVAAAAQGTCQSLSCQRVCLTKDQHTLGWGGGGGGEREGRGGSTYNAGGRREGGRKEGGREGEGVR